MTLFKKKEELHEVSLVKSLRKGDESSFEWIFRLYYAPLVVMAMRWVKDRDCAQNIVQNVFVRLWEKRSSVHITSLQSYLRVAVRNSCMNELKHANVVREHTKRFVDEEIEEEYDVSEDLFTQRVYDAIEELPPQRKRIFLLSRVEGKKYREIAEVLHLSQKTVEAQMGKALQFLRTKLVAIRTQMQSVLF